MSGYNESRVRDLVVAGFSSPLNAPKEMIRCTFIVGGGKLVRSKYSEDLPKWMAMSLRDIGYSEDRSAAETFDSQGIYYKRCQYFVSFASFLLLVIIIKLFYGIIIIGTFKQQHDTGQNLKYVIVYPRVTCAEKGSGSGGSQGNSNESSQIDTSSPEYLVCASELSTFKDLINVKTSSWRQRKCMLKVLQDGAERFSAIEEKLVAGQPLTPIEQAIYESNSGSDKEKISHLQSVIKSLVDDGKLSASEKVELIASLETNLTSVEEEIKVASEENKPKKMEKLQEKKQNLLARKEFVSKLQPIQHRLKHGQEVHRLWLRLLPLLTLEEKSSSMSLTLADLKTLSEKPDIEAEIARLESASRGWFEDEADHKSLCQVEERDARVKYAAHLKAQAAKKPASGSTQGNRTGSSGSAWGTVSGGKKSNGSAYGSAAPKKAVKSGFASAFNDSDSD